MGARTPRDDASGPPPPVDVPGYPAVLPRVSRAAERDLPAFVYTPELGELIADLYVDEPGGLWGIHSAMPDRVPSPAVIRAWERRHPAFAILLRDAERVRAEKLMEESVALADTSPLAAPRVALQIAARQRFAEKLDRARWGDGGGSSAATPALARPGEQATALELDDVQLMALAAAGLPDAAPPGEGDGTPR